jgi:acylphosphatase
MVGFRAFVLDHGTGLRGTVVNRADGSLECVVEGPQQHVDQLVRLLHEGPSHARVETVDVEPEPYRGDLPPLTVRV